MTINMPRIAYLAKDEKDFYKRLDHMMDNCCQVFKDQEGSNYQASESGTVSLYEAVSGTFENHFSTIGLVGMNEAGLNAKWIRQDMTHPSCQKLPRKCWSI